MEVGGTELMKPRPFGLVDAMIMVAALAVGLWVNRTDWLGFASLWYGDAYDRIQRVLSLLTPHVAAATMALVAIRMRRPRPPLRRLLRSPGAVACTVASAAIVLIVCWAVSALALGRGITFSQHIELLPYTGRGHGRGGGTRYPFSGKLLTTYGDHVAFAVAGAWLSLLLAGRWRPERTWIDRAGRALGWIWLGLAVMLWTRSFLL
jgi:hypothetical protein